MQIRNGVYRGRKSFQGVEHHGGATMRWTHFAHLCFYLAENVVGYYLAPDGVLQPYFSRNFLYRGEITYLSEREITIVIKDPYRNDKIIFSGEILGDKMQLKRTRQNAPEELVIDDIFEFVGP